MSGPSGKNRSEQEVKTGRNESMILNLWMHFRQVSVSKEGPKMAKLGSRAASSSIGKSGTAILQDPNFRPFTFCFNSDETVGSESMIYMLRSFIFLVTSYEIAKNNFNSYIACYIGH